MSLLKRLCGCLISVTLVTCASSATSAQTSTPFEMIGNFAGKSPGRPALDISGIACMDPPGAASRRCVVVNDENRTAQTATITGRKLIAGDVQIDLIGPDFVGAQPDVSCPGGVGKAGEFDGEAVAYAAPYFYVVGSHGCSRNKGEFRATSFYLARFQLDAGGKPGNLTRTTRLTSVFRGAANVGAYFGKSLDSKSNGLNIEGLIVTGDRLTVGLRAPSVDGKAFVVTTSLKALFADGAQDGAMTGEVASLALGQRLGIRDLSPLPDGRTLILVGPAQEQNLGYSIYVAEFRKERQSEIAVTLLGTLAPPSGARSSSKVEALTVIEATNTAVRLLILYDGLPNGQPTEFTFPLK